MTGKLKSKSNSVSFEPQNDDEDNDVEEGAEDEDLDEEADMEEFFEEEEQERDEDFPTSKSNTKKSFSDPLLDEDDFKVAEMDEFAELMEQKMEEELEEEEKATEKNTNNEEEDEDEDDLDSYDSGDGEDDFKFVKRSLYNVDEDDDEDVNLKYEDFFGAQAVNGKQKNKKGTKEDESEEEDTKSQKIRKRDIQKEELQQQIAELEKQAINPKSWEYKGETKGNSRPKESLLEKGDLDVNFVKKTTSDMTPEIAKGIEALILQRVLDKKFDDLERGDKKKELLPYQPILSQEKSKLGLADTYAKDYEEKVLNQTPKEKVEVEKERAEIRDMFEKLCQKLDALSNLQFTPKPPPTKDVNRPADIAAIHMEDLVPTTETGGSITQAAPEEIERKTKGLGKSDKEMEPEEKKAARRRAKTASKKRRAADGVVIIPKKKVKESVIEEKEKTKWTSSAQVFRKIGENQKA